MLVLEYFQSPWIYFTLKHGDTRKY
uniref:Uncharacterized protein n=1 Tax=Anguilla anguilla TaxID=7936 RepID=A0A0E9R187_ANGAN